LAPLDIPHHESINAILSLYEMYKIPEDFVSERLHQVACSFGHQEERQGSNFSWFHFLCKNIPVEPVTKDGKTKLKIKGEEHHQLSQANFTWIRSAYFLKTESPVRLEGPMRTTLIVFGRDRSLEGKLADLLWDAELDDPHRLFAIVFEILYIRVDHLVWNPGNVYNQEETDILESANRPTDAAQHLDFVGMHLLSKHQTFLHEAIEAVMTTLDAATDHHEQYSGGLTNMSLVSRRVQADFRYRKTLFSSTKLRLGSLEKRTHNMINLAFNLITQADSRIMKADSSSMRIIAVMTLVFLPCTAVATVYSTPFFYLEESKNSLTMASCVWLVWVVTIPVTGVVLCIWWCYQKSLSKRVQDTQPSTRERSVPQSVLRLCLRILP
ncbi:hypothetical protein BJ875DRAFT_385464, partial [Amylocarpus encephaloides]